MEDWIPVKRNEPILDVINFLESQNILTAYADYWIAHKATFLSENNILVSEFSSSVRGKKQKSLSMNNSNFAVIVRPGKEEIIYRNYLSENEISYQEIKLSRFKVFWGFEGNWDKVEQLRSLVN